MGGTLDASERNSRTRGAVVEDQREAIIRAADPVLEQAAVGEGEGAFFGRGHGSWCHARDGDEGAVWLRPSYRPRVVDGSARLQQMRAFKRSHLLERPGLLTTKPPAHRGF
jgi:hypothetical protein